MRALLVTPDFPPEIGGIQAILYNVTRRLTRVRMTVVTYDHPSAAAFDRSQTFSIHRVNRAKVKSRARGGYGFASMIVKTLRVIRREGVDVVVCGHPIASPIGMVAKRLLRKPYVVWTYASELLHYRYLHGVGLRYADAVLVISEHTRRLVTELGVSVEKTVLIPLAPDCDPMHEIRVENPSDQLVRPSTRQPVILTISRMGDLYKGHDMMLRAMPLIAAKVPNVRWVVVGEGPLRGYYERITHAIGMQGNIYFTGSLSPAVPEQRAERDRLLESCDVFVMISRDRKIDGGGEGFGIVFLEASAFGKPVVAGRAGGALDAIVDGVTGLLVDPENELEITEAVVRLLTDPELATQLGAQGQEWVRRNFTWDRTAKAVEELLFEVASRPLAVASRGT